MDCQDYITGPAERKKGQHLQREERGAIQHLKCQGYTNRAIAREIGCSPSAVANELRRGTPPRKSNKGRKPGYSARHGEAVYKANRKHSRKHHRICRCAHFLRWVVKQFKEHKWSLDACVGYARLHGLFPADEMVCTRTLYNEVWASNLDLSVTELPEAMKRKQHKDSKPREHKKSFGADISQRPEIAALRIEEGHWEGDTVVGKRAGKEAVVLSLLEKKTENYIAIQIPGKDADSVLNAMQSLREEFGDKFSQFFKTITLGIDNQRAGAGDCHLRPVLALDNGVFRVPIVRIIVVVILRTVSQCVGRAGGDDDVHLGRLIAGNGSSRETCKAQAV